MINALIQYNDLQSVNAAKLVFFLLFSINQSIIHSLTHSKKKKKKKKNLNGKQLYEGCGILRIQDSPLKELKIEFNNEKSWDFTKQLPPGPINKQRCFFEFLNLF